MSIWIYLSLFWCENAPMNDWDDYRFILALERSGSVRGAAELLGVNHSTVSRKLTWLNQRQGEPLFERTPKGYQITDSGRMWLKAAEDMEAIVLSSQRKYRGRQDAQLSGRVSLSVSIPIAQYLLADALPQFAQDYPGIELCIDASELNVDLDRSEADVVLRSTNSPPEHLVGRRLFPYGVSYYAHRDYLAQTNMEDYTWIGTEADDTFPPWLEQSPYPHAPVTTRTTGYHMRFLALTAKLGLSRGACFMADNHPELVRLPGAEVFTHLDFWILTHPDLRQSPRVRAVMDFLNQCMTEKKDLILGQRPQPY